EQAGQRMAHQLAHAQHALGGAGGAVAVVLVVSHWPELGPRRPSVNRRGAGAGGGVRCLPMRAVVIEQYGEPGAVLAVRELPVPEPARGQVLIKMKASPINPSDMVFVEGNYGYRKTLPTVPGSEGAGTVVAANAGPYGSWLMGKRVACAAAETGNGT